MSDEKKISSAPEASSDASIEETGGQDGPERAAWGGQLEFILTCVGYAVGLGNVWRFPYLCYKNGGGAFLIPYVCMLAFVGLPLFYMELCIGQFGSLGPLAVWKFAPIFKGLGFASVMVSLLIAMYYNVIIAICIFYFFKSMTATLPWTDCSNAWNNASTCITLKEIEIIKENATGNLSMPTGPITTPSEDFFYNEVLRLTEGLDVPGGMRWELAGCLLLAWVIVCVVLIRGIASLGKVVYFTALFPYVLLTVLLVRGAMLEGSLQGVIYYLKPQWHKLGEAQVWSDAAVQIFYSLSVASGGLIAMASYNKFHNNVLRDSLIVPVVNCLTSIYAGFVIFSILGYMANRKGVDISEVAAQGPGLTFVVYPEALSTMPAPPVWACLFFFMMITLGFSSSFSMMECVMTAFLDEYPQWLKTSRKREIMFRIGTCILGFLCGLPMVMESGFYLLTLADNYVGGFPLIIVGIGELVAINWVYGFKNFNRDIKIMLGRPAPIYFMIMWVGFSPLLMAIIGFCHKLSDFTGVDRLKFLVFSYPDARIHSLMMGILGFTSYQYKPLTFQGWVYTPGFSALGWLIVVFCVMFIPLVALIQCCKMGGFEALKRSASPTSDWGPVHQEDRVGTVYENMYRKESTELENVMIINGVANGGYTSDLPDNSIYSTVPESAPIYDEASKM